MFTELSQLISKANLKQLSLSVQDAGNGRLNVVVMTENNIGDAVDPKLRAALTQPLKLTASANDLDEGFITHLNSFSESYVDSTMKANTAQATDSMDKASAQAAPEKPTDPVSDALGEDAQPNTDDAASSIADLDLD